MTESKRTKTMTISPEQKTKNSFVLRHLCPVHEVLTGISDAINIRDKSVWIHLVRESVHLTFSLGISKTVPLATMSQQPHARWELRNWSPSTWLVTVVCGHFTLAWEFVSHACTISCQVWLYTTSTNSLMAIVHLNNKYFLLQLPALFYLLFSRQHLFILQH